MDFNEIFKEIFSLTKDGSIPNTSPLAEKLRNLPAFAINTKLFGHELAEKYYGYKRLPEKYDAFTQGWKASVYDDFLQKWFIDTCEELKIAPVLHRKVWEETYVVNTLRSKLKPGMKGIVFGVGEERLPSLFASYGCKILATDLNPNEDASKGWAATAQLGSLDKIYHADLVDRESFDRLVSFEYADMNNIGEHLHGQFDFCWTLCAFEHLGSIEKGLQFIKNTGKLLKPDGISAHTTEFNYSRTDTIDNWGTVLFRKSDFENLYSRLSSYKLPPANYDVGVNPVDSFIDMPPYAWHEGHNENLNHCHLKLMVDGFPSTCFGVSFQKA
jgi:SAM-dependent methyltransferase